MTSFQWTGADLYEKFKIDDIDFYVDKENKELAKSIIKSTNKNLALMNIKHIDDGIKAIVKYKLGISKEGYNPFESYKKMILKLIGLMDFDTKVFKDEWFGIN